MIMNNLMKLLIIFLAFSVMTSKIRRFLPDKNTQTKINQILGMAFLI